MCLEKNDAVALGVLIACACAALGEKDEAFAYLEKAVQMRDSPLLALNVNPRSDPLCSDPRFIALVHRIEPEK